MEKLRKFWKDEEGIEIVEWALMCAGFALAMWAAFGGLVTTLTNFYGEIANKLPP